MNQRAHTISLIVLYNNINRSRESLRDEIISPWEHNSSTAVYFNKNGYETLNVCVKFMPRY